MNESSGATSDSVVQNSSLSIVEESQPPSALYTPPAPAHADHDSPSVPNTGSDGTARDADSPAAPSSASASATYAELNPDFSISAQPLETQFDWIEKEFAAIEARTMNPRQYNFSTSYSFPTKNRYINVMANEETVFPPPRSSLAVRSSALSPRSSGAAVGSGEAASFKANSVTASDRSTPLYFNANVVDMGVEPVFVASQAPVLDCMEDFFNAIYNAEISLVLMLTETEEAGFVKADRYWPADKASGLAGEVFGNMCVYKDLNDPYSIDAPHELIRRPFFVRPCNAPKEKEHKVVMVQYVGWPDRGVPDSTESFEELLRIIKKHVQSCPPRSSAEKKSTSAARSNALSALAALGFGGGTGSATKPMPSVLVHCSAGIGRTGTLIGAYTAVRLMEEGKLRRDSISKIVADMRKARFGMVQRVEQYMFLYLIVLQHLGVDTGAFVARMQPRADLYNYRWMEARQAAMAARGSR